MKRKNAIRLLSLLLVICALLPMVGCKKGADDLKVGVLWEDDTSGESAAWAKYLRALAKDYGFTIDFTTTNSSSSEVSAINTYASKGYDAILLLSDDDIVTSVTAAAAKKMYIICPTGHPTDAQLEEIRGNEYYLGSIAPTYDAEFAAGYNMARYFVEEKKQTVFTVFGGATLYGSQMHVQRLAGILAYLCEDEGTSYDGAKTRNDLIAKISGSSLDPAKFVSSEYRIAGYMDGFGFDDAFSTKLTNSLENGGTCILTVGAGEVVTKIAYGITSANAKLETCTVGGVDAITSDYAACFDLGYAYDCGKYASAMAPSIVAILCAVNGKKIKAPDGNAPQLGLTYWVATSKTALEEMLKNDNATDGYCYNKAVLDHYIEAASYDELSKLCAADYAGAVAIHNTYNEK